MTTQDQATQEQTKQDPPPNLMQASMDRVLAEMKAQHEAQAKEARRVSWPAFLDLLTDAEEDALLARAMSDLATKRWYDRAVGAGEVDLDDARVVAGLAALVEAGALAADRRDAILQGIAPQA